jgi:predicted amidohydrolase YtcJ
MRNSYATPLLIDAHTHMDHYGADLEAAGYFRQEYWIFSRI